MNGILFFAKILIKKKNPVKENRVPDFIVVREYRSKIYKTRPFKLSHVARHSFYANDGENKKTMTPRIRRLVYSSGGGDQSLSVCN